MHNDLDRQNAKLSNSKDSKKIKQQKEKAAAKHRFYVLDEWLKTQITYKEDIQAALQIIKKQLLKQKLLQSEAEANLMFPEFHSMLKLSQNMISILSSCGKGMKTSSNLKTQRFPLSIKADSILIGKQLSQIASFYKIYLEYFKQKSEMKKIYDRIAEKEQSKLRSVENQLKQYFVKKYQNAPVNPKANITILDCLQKPLYRPFKYPLLLDNYLKKLPEEHSDYNELNKARKTFIQICEKCNNSITQQQKQALKLKLQNLYGRTLPQTSHYKATMTAETLYFPCKIYIFSNLVIISKAEKLIGYRQQKLYMNLGIDEFSYINYKRDLKYFKNVLILCGVYECIHFFLPDKGTRLQLYQIVNQIIYEQKLKALSKRQHTKQTKSQQKINFLLDYRQKNYRTWLTSLRIEVIDVDMRSLGIFTNDTVFILTISFPAYVEDQVFFHKKLRGGKQGEEQFSFLKGNENSNQNSQLRNSTSSESQFGNQQHPLLSQMKKSMLEKKGSVERQSTDNFLNQNSSKSANIPTLHQRFQIHLDQLIELHQSLKQQFPEIRFPQIDPLSKDFNFYTQSKKKTKSFEVRTFLIEEFFNFIFRHPSIMEHPLKILPKLRIDEVFWSYADERTRYARNEKPQKEGNWTFDQNHCRICSETTINSLDQFQSLNSRRIALGNRKAKKQNYCFNSYKLIRYSVLGFSKSQFMQNMARMLLYQHYFHGRVDYNFLFYKQISKKHKVIQILIPRIIYVEDRSSETEDQGKKQKKRLDLFYKTTKLHCDYKTRVGMVIADIAKDLDILNLLDYRLVLQFNEQERILDQDEFMENIIDKYQLEYQDYEELEGSSVGKSSILRNTIKEQVLVKSGFSFFDSIKNWLPKKKSKTFLYLKKMIYFPLQYQIQATGKSIQKVRLISAQLLSKISTTSITLPLENWAQICALYYCLIFKNIHEELKRISSKTKQIIEYCRQVLPQEKCQIVHNKIFIEKMMAIFAEKSKVIAKNEKERKFNLQDFVCQQIMPRLLKVSYHSFKLHTYFVTVMARIVPSSVIIDDKLNLTGECFLGVNNSQIVVMRQKSNALIPAARMPLQDLEIVHSVYSIFLTYKRQSSLKETDQIIEELELRFDSKMLHGFVELCRKYQFFKTVFMLESE